MLDTCWIEVTVDTSTGEAIVYIEGLQFCVNDIYPGADNAIGCTFTMRRTEAVGLHFAVYDSIYNDPDPDDYLYTMRCNTPGTYYLGANYGYRRKTVDEEECPLRRVFREWGLSVDLVHEHPTNHFLVRRTTATHVPIGNRYLYDETDAQKEQLVDERFGRDTVALTDFTYVICIEEEEDRPVVGYSKSTFKWISGVYLSRESSESTLEEVGERVTEIMQMNKRRRLHGSC